MSPRVDLPQVPEGRGHFTNLKSRERRPPSLEGSILPGHSRDIKGHSPGSSSCKRSIPRLSRLHWVFQGPRRPSWGSKTLLPHKDGSTL